MPPRDVCGVCLSNRLAPEAVPGTGTVVGATMIRRPPLALRERGPYVVAMVRSDAGPFITGRVEGDAPPPGTRVELTAYDGDAPVFRAVM